MKKDVRTFGLKKTNGVLATGEGDVLDTAEFRDKVVEYAGNFTNITAKLMISIDGTNYRQLGADITAAGLTSVAHFVNKMRIDIAVSGSPGTAVFTFGGLGRGI